MILASSPQRPRISESSMKEEMGHGSHSLLWNANISSHLPLLCSRRSIMLTLNRSGSTAAQGHLLWLVYSVIPPSLPSFIRQTQAVFIGAPEQRFIFSALAGSAEIKVLTNPLIEENGPCRVDIDGNVYSNPYSWSNASNMICEDEIFFLSLFLSQQYFYILNCVWKIPVSGLGLSYIRMSSG